MVGKSLQTEEDTQRPTAKEKLLQQGTALLDEGIEAKKERLKRGTEPLDRRTRTWRFITKFVRMDSCLQANAAEFILQGQILPTDPGPRSSTATNARMDRSSLLAFDVPNMGINTKAWRSLQPPVQVKVFDKKLPLSLPLVGVKPSPAAEGGAKI